MSSYTQRVTRLLAAIEEQVKFLIPTATISHAFDVNSDEYITVAVGARTHIVRGKPETAPASGLTDGLGLPQKVFVPTVLQVGLDTTAEAAGLDAATESAQAALYLVVGSKGTRCTVFSKAGIALADMVDGSVSTVLNFQPAYDGTGYLGNI